MSKNTPYAEGRAAGYRNAPEANPYRKGLDALRDADAIVWAQQWDDGYLFGQHQGRDDVIAKHRDGCR